MNVQKSFRSTRDSSEGDEREGILYLVGTPIGNLEDITYRAVRILQEANLIAAEDTRQTRKLLSHFEIRSRIVSYHEHNKTNSGPELVRLLQQGQSIALVSDAGMPAISDPGYELVQLAIAAGLSVVSVPGPNAALSALVVSGLPTDTFTFAGFLPRDKKSATRRLAELQRYSGTLLFYESPHRIVKTLQLLLELWGDRSIALARELTKRYEEIVRGTITAALEHLALHPPLGEYVLVVKGGGEGAGAEEGPAWWEALTPEQHVDHYARDTGDRKDAIKRAAVDRGMPKRELYNMLVTKH